MSVFNSHDGPDDSADHTRAEVRVEVGEATVTAIDKKTTSAQVTLNVENNPKIKKPVKAWVSINSPVFAEAERLLASKEIITYRIEQQRKKSEDRKTPMDELRKDMETANRTTTRVYAALNGVVSDEAVTNPKEDPSTSGGRFKATEDDFTPTGASTSTAPAATSDSLLASIKALSDLSPATDVLAAAVGAAIALGADPAAVFKIAGGTDRAENEAQPAPRNSYATEGPGWKEWNSDGRVNLGHMRFSAGVGAESFTRERLVTAGLKEQALEEGVAYFTKLILSIADGVQTKAYGQGSTPDRGAQSHARARGIIYDTIKNYTPLPYPVTEGANPVDAIKKWVIEVGTTAYERFVIGLEASDSRKSFNEPLPELLYGKTIVEEKPVITPNAAKKAEKKAAEPTLPVEEPPAEPQPVAEPINLDDYAIFEKVDIKTLPPEKQRPLATKETLDELTTLVKESGLLKEDYPLVGNLLKYTFGENHGQSKTIPDPILTDFLDFYIGAGEENFLSVLKGIPRN